MRYVYLPLSRFYDPQKGYAYAMLQFYTDNTVYVT